MQPQHEKILSEIKWRGEVSIRDSDFVNWYRSIFKGKTKIEWRLSSVLSDMCHRGILDRYVDSPKGAQYEQYVYHLKE